MFDNNGFDTTVDILMATYNGERYLEEQIRSIQAQTFTGWHLLVSDDCSTDRTLEIIQHLATEDDRIRLVSSGTRKGGAKENFFYLMSQSTADYVFFCDQDDVWLPDKMALSLEHMLKNAIAGKPNCLYTDLAIVDRRLNTMYESRFAKAGVSGKDNFASLLFENRLTGCTVLVDRALLRRAMKCFNLESVIMHDWWVGLIAVSQGRLIRFERATMLYRQHEANVVGEQRKTIKQLVVGAKEGFNRKVAQASYFVECYKECLTKHDLDFAQQLSQFARLSLPKRLSLINSNGLWGSSPSERVNTFIHIVAP